MTCSVEICDREVFARGWCAGHYQRWRNHGDLRPDVPIKQYRKRGQKKKEKPRPQYGYFAKLSCVWVPSDATREVKTAAKRFADRTNTIVVTVDHDSVKRLVEIAGAEKINVSGDQNE